MNKKMGNTQKGITQQSHLNNTSTSAQRQRLLATLMLLGAVNTLYARDQLNILMPASRINELRNQGHQIDTYRITIKDQHGRTHRAVARYVLITLAGGR